MTQSVWSFAGSDRDGQFANWFPNRPSEPKWAPIGSCHFFSGSSSSLRDNCCTFWSKVQFLPAPPPHNLFFSLLLINTSSTSPWSPSSPPSSIPCPSPSPHSILKPRSPFSSQLISWQASYFNNLQTSKPESCASLQLCDWPSDLCRVWSH